MAFVTQRYHYPALGKDSELRGVLIELVQSLQAKGRRAALSSQLFAPEGIVLVNSVIHDSLGDYEDHLHYIASDSAAQALIQRTNALYRAPQHQAIAEILVPPAAPAASVPLSYRWAVQFYPSLGKNRDLQSHLTELTQSLQAQGVRSSLSVQLFSQGAVLNISSWYESLAALQATRSKIQADPDFTAAIAKAATLSATPAKASLYMIIVPMPS